MGGPIFEKLADWKRGDRYGTWITGVKSVRNESSLYQSMNNLTTEDRGYTRSGTVRTSLFPYLLNRIPDTRSSIDRDGSFIHTIATLNVNPNPTSPVDFLVDLTRSTTFFSLLPRHRHHRDAT